MKQVINLSSELSKGSDREVLSPSDIKDVQKMVEEIGSGEMPGMFIVVTKRKVKNSTVVEGHSKIVSMNDQEVLETILSTSKVSKPDLVTYIQSREDFAQDVFEPAPKREYKEKPEAMNEENSKEALDLVTRLANAEINGAFFIIEDLGESSNVLGKVNNQSRAQMLRHILHALQMDKRALEVFIKREMD